MHKWRKRQSSHRAWKKHQNNRFKYLPHTDFLNFSSQSVGALAWLFHFALKFYLFIFSLTCYIPFCWQWFALCCCNIFALLQDHDDPRSQSDRSWVIVNASSKKNWLELPYARRFRYSHIHPYFVRWKASAKACDTVISPKVSMRIPTMTKA